MNEERRSSEEQASDVGQLLRALLVTLVSIGMLLGSFLLARLDVPPVPSTETRAIARGPTITPFLPTLTPQPSPSTVATERVPARPSEEDMTEAYEGVPSPTPAPARPGALPPTPACTRPPGWFIYTVRPGDTLAELARQSGTTTLILMRRNCLETTVLFAGQHLYLPLTFYPSPTSEPYPCWRPMNWVIYVVQPGDTLYSLSRRFNVEIEALRWSNCLKSYAIYAGDRLYVPPFTPTPWPTATPTPTSSPSSTPTGLPTTTTATVGPTSSPTLPPSPTTETPSPTSPTPTSTPPSSPTPPTVSPTRTPTLGPTPIPSPMLTATPPSPSPTATPTFTPMPTWTPTSPPPATESPTSTSPPSSTSGG